LVDTANKFSLWAIEIFVASVEEGSISAAAKRLIQVILPFPSN